MEKKLVVMVALARDSIVPVWITGIIHPPFSKRLAARLVNSYLSLYIIDVIVSLARD